MADDSDPRVFFAAERTLLAWIRTGLTIIALGFVVARFGLFLELLTAGRNMAAPAQPSWQSSALGIALVLLGAFAVLAALANHLTYVKTLPPRDIPVLPMRWLPLVASASIVIIGILLAGYLVASHA